MEGETESDYSVEEPLGERSEGYSGDDYSIREIVRRKVVYEEWSLVKLLGYSDIAARGVHEALEEFDCLRRSASQFRVPGYKRAVRKGQLHLRQLRDVANELWTRAKDGEEKRVMPPLSSSPSQKTRGFGGAS